MLPVGFDADADKDGRLATQFLEDPQNVGGGCVGRVRLDDNPAAGGNLEHCLQNRFRDCPRAGVGWEWLRHATDEEPYAFASVGLDLFEIQFIRVTLQVDNVTPFAS